MRQNEIRITIEQLIHATTKIRLGKFAWKLTIIKILNDILIILRSSSNLCGWQVLSLL